MNVSAEQLEFVVREVMRRLAVTPLPPNDAMAVADQLRIEDRVVTTATLDGRMTGISQVAVSADAIVTPAVLDLLKDRTIELVRWEATAEIPAEVCPVLLAFESSHRNTESIAKQIRSVGGTVRTATLTDFEQLGRLLKPNETAVVLANKPFEAALSCEPGCPSVCGPCGRLSTMRGSNERSKCERIGCPCKSRRRQIDPDICEWNASVKVTSNANREDRRNRNT